MSSGSNTAMWAVAFVIFLIVIAIFLRAIGFSIAGWSGSNKCAKEVKQHSFAIKSTSLAQTIPFGGTIQEQVSSQIECETKEKRFTGGEDRVKKKLAEEMLWCWETWGKGELDLFAQDEGYFCHVCTRITFKEEMKIDNLYKYLATEPQNNPYLTQMAPFESEEVEKIRQYEEIDQNVPPIDTTDEYAVVFKYVKGEERFLNLVKKKSVRQAGVLVGTGSPLVLSGWSAIVGTGLGIVMATSIQDTAERYSYVALVPYSQEGLQEDLGCTVSPASQEQ